MRDTEFACSVFLTCVAADEGLRHIDRFYQGIYLASPSAWYALFQACECRRIARVHLANAKKLVGRKAWIRGAVRRRKGRQ